MVLAEKWESTEMFAKLHSYIVLVLMAVTWSACAQEKDVILELKDVQFFNAQETKASPVTIRITGLVFHSSLGIQDVTTSQHGDCLRVFVQLAPATPGRSGNLDYTLTVPTSIQKVTFGKNGVVIWDRASGIMQHK